MGNKDNESGGKDYSNSDGGGDCTVTEVTHDSANHASWNQKSWSGKSKNPTYNTSDSSACTPQQEDKPNTLMSPNYPCPYPNHFYKTYKLEVNPGYLVNINFDHFDLEDSTECNYDYIIVKE